MRNLAIGAFCGSIAVQPCTRAPAAPQQEGWQVYQDSHITRTAACVQQPVLLSGDHIDFTLNGACNHVRVAGDHSDIMIQVGPAATIEIAGGHNDVPWQQVVPGPPPHLADNGISNTFHHAR